AHLDSEAASLVQAFRQLEGLFPVVRKVEAAGSRLNFSPSRAKIKFLSKRKTGQIFDRLGNVVRFDFSRAHIRGNVDDQAFAKTRDDLVGRRGGHDHVIVGDAGVRWVLRKGSLIYPIFYGWPGSEVVLIPVVNPNACLSRIHRGGG